MRLFLADGAGQAGRTDFRQFPRHAGLVLSSLRIVIFLFIGIVSLPFAGEKY
jgi:hypothetical protein